MTLLDRVRRSGPRAVVECECRRCHAVFLSAATEPACCPQCDSTDVGPFVP